MGSTPASTAAQGLNLINWREVTELPSGTGSNSKSSIQSKRFIRDLNRL